MSVSNEAVVQEFLLSGTPCASENLSYTKYTAVDKQIIRTLKSYASTLAVIWEGRLFIDDAHYSKTTARHVSLLTRENSALYPVGYVAFAAAIRNVADRVMRARNALADAIEPSRKRMQTRVQHFSVFRKRVQVAQELSQMPVYAGGAVTADTKAALAQLVNIRDAANPTGLDPFNADMLLRVKAVTALEGI